MTNLIDINDPLLGVPAGGVPEPEFPVLREGKYRLVVRGLDFKVTEKDGKETRRVDIKLATTGDTDLNGNRIYDTAGRPVSAGFTFTHSIFLTPNEKNTPEDIKRKAAQPLRAMGVPEVSMAQAVNEPGLVVDKLVDAQVGIRKASGEYSASNNIKTWYEPKQS